MKRLIPLFLVSFALMASGDPAKLGTLNRNSDVMVEGLYPVFQIWVPEGVTEVQIRASVNNFQNSFRLSQSGHPNLIYRCTGTRNGRNFYQTDDQANVAYWIDNRWEFTHDDLTATDNVQFPWQCTNFSPAGYTVTELDNDDKFVYRWCSTGQGADGTWDTGVQDGDAEMFFSNQKGSNPYSQYRMQRWLGDTADAIAAGYPGTALTAQMQATGTPGRYVIFQPSRDGHLLSGVNGDWMRQSNKYLQWVVQYETVAGWEKHPDGSAVWSAIRPVEWRAERLELQQAK